MRDEDIERKEKAILKILEEAGQPLGARAIAQKLREEGIALSPRTVRYHLKLMDERGFTKIVTKREGRVITEAGRQELRNALVRDKVGFVIARIELLAFRTEFDWERKKGAVPANITLFRKKDFQKALKIMRHAFKAGFAVSDLVAVACEGEKLGEMRIPEGKVGLATICSVIVNGCLLKAGIPLESRFGGILEVRDFKPYRFTDFIMYSGSSLDPSEAFIKAKMTRVGMAARTGGGKVLANYREIPGPCRSAVLEVIEGLGKAGIRGVVVLGEVGESVCGIPVGLNRCGLVLLGGLNPVACVEEEGIETELFPMSALLDYESLTSFWELAGERRS